MKNENKKSNERINVNDSKGEKYTISELLKLGEKTDYLELAKTGKDDKMNGKTN